MCNHVTQGLQEQAAEKVDARMLKTTGAQSRQTHETQPARSPTRHSDDRGQPTRLTASGAQALEQSGLATNPATTPPAKRRRTATANPAARR